MLRLLLRDHQSQKMPKRATDREVQAVTYLISILLLWRGLVAIA